MPLYFGVFGLLYVLFCEIDLDPAFLELAHSGKRVDGVTREATDRFREDKVDFPVKRILYHALEAIAFFRARGGNSLVGVDLDHRPV